LPKQFDVERLRRPEKRDGTAVEPNEFRSGSEEAVKRSSGWWVNSKVSVTAKRLAEIY
jgi:hypothetical protein